jgi:hypothetical protein
LRILHSRAKQSRLNIEIKSGLLRCPLRGLLAMTI